MGSTMPMSDHHAVTWNTYSNRGYFAIGNFMGFSNKSGFVRLDERKAAEFT